jgi:transcriptional regulator with XRE-family HTH domain
MAADRRDAILAAFGAAVRDARAARALSQEALAERAGLHRTYVGDIERGERNVSLHNVWRLAAALELEPGALVGDADGRIRRRKRRVR